MLAPAVVKLDNTIYLDIDHFNIWLSLGKDEISDFRNLRTKQQILQSSYFKENKLNKWLRNREWNGLHHAVIKKGERRLYIDIHKFNAWLCTQNSNADYGKNIKAGEAVTRLT